MTDNSKLAFPSPERKNPQADYPTPATSGMTLRQWYAGMALQGLIMRDNAINTGTAALKSFDFADAMLKESEK